MSEFAPLQKEECEDILKKDDLPKPEICPDCVPNPKEPKRDWLREKEPYKDLRTCEYITRILVTKIQNAELIQSDTLKGLADARKEVGVRELLRHFNKLENEEVVEGLGFIPEDGVIVDDDGIIKAKVVINAIDFDAIPEAPESEDAPPDNNTDLPDRLEIDDSQFDFYINFATVKLALTGYDLKYAYFQKIEEGALRYDVDGRFELFKINQLQEEITELRDLIYQFVEINEFSFLRPETFFNFNDKVQKFEIEFDNSDPENPLKINKVFVVSEQCPKVELKKGLPAFKKSAYMPTALYFLTNFHSIYSDVTMDDPKPWIDVLTDYIYPPLKVDYGESEASSEISETGLACALNIDPLDIFKNALKGFLVDTSDIFEFEFGKNTCSDAFEDREPTLKQFFNSRQQKRFEKEYKAKLETLKRTNVEYKRLSAPVDRNQGETDAAYEKRKKKRKIELDAYKEGLSDLAQKLANEEIQKLLEKNPKYFAHPLDKQFREALKARAKKGDSLFSIWKDLKGLTANSKGQKFLDIVGLCGVTKGLKNAAKCLFKQVSFDDAIKTAIRAIFLGFPMDRMQEIMVGLDPQKQIEIRLKIEQQLGDFKFPWETGGKIDTSKVNKSTEIILEAYMEALIEFLKIDELIELFKDNPAIAMIIEFSKSFIKCPSKVLKDVKNLSKLGEFKIDVCNPALPILPKIPKIEWANPWKIVSKSFIAAIREAMAKVISMLIKKFLDWLEGLICSGLELLGKAALNPWDFFGNNNFLESLKEAFCPEANDEEVKGLANNLLNKIGATDDDASSAIDCLSGALLGIMSLSDMKNLMLNPEQNPVLLDRVIDAVRIGCPRFEDLLNNRPRVVNFFDNLGGFIPPEGRVRLQEIEDSILEVPVYDSICLTSTELDRWNDMRRSTLQGYGLSPEDAASQVELYNSRAREALQDVLGDLSQNPNQAFLDALEDLMSPKPDLPPGCELGEGQSMFGSKALQEPEEIVKIQDEISNRIFDIIGDSFKREFTNNPNPFKASLVSRILADTQGNSYEFHKFLDNFVLTDMDYHDSEGSQKIQEDAPFYKKPLGGLLDGLFEDAGYFPETVGKNCQNKILEEREYTTTKETNAEITRSLTVKGIDYKIIKPEIEASDYQIEFEWGTVAGFEPSTETTGYISDVNIGTKRTKMDYKIFTECSPRGLFKISKISPDITPQMENILSDHAVDDSLKYKNSVFNYFLNTRMDPIVSRPSFDKEETYRITNEIVFNEITSLCASGSVGFIFGYEDEDLTPEELLYVGPNGEDPYSEFFKESDRVLGRALVPNDRVTFLNPETYGGSYVIPPIYIAPKDMNGWMKISKVLSPDEEQCEPRSESVLKFSDIKKHVNNVRNRFKIDSRVASNVEKCFVEKPFDKIISKNAVAGIDGIVKMHIRMKIVEEITRSIPIISNVEFLRENFDNSSVSLILESLIKDLKSIDPWGPRTFEKNNYYILILEQAFQSYERSVIKNLPDIDGGKDLSSLSADVQEAVRRILETRNSFSFNNIQLPKGNVTFKLFDDPQSPALDTSLLNNENFMLYALAYQKYGEAIFTSNSTLEYNGVEPLFLFKDKKNLFSVILSVRLVEEECKIILREMLLKEYEEIMEFFYKQYEPKIKSLPRYFMTSTNIFHENKITSFGTYSYEKTIGIGSFASMGKAEEVVDVNESSPWGTLTDESTKFKIERYVRLKEKDNLEVSEELKELLNSRDHKLRGVVNIEELQNFFDQNIELFGDYNITDIFGDASIPEGSPQSYEGEIGMKYGLRIIMKLPNTTTYPNDPTTGDLELSRLEKTYYCDILNFASSDINFSIPMCSAEVDVIDKPIKELNLLTGQGSYNLDCLARKLSDTTEYNFFFGCVVPLKAAASLALNYCNLYFLKSIGQDDGWDDNAKKIQIDTENQFEKTNLTCRRFFASFYNSNKFYSKFEAKLPKLEFPDFWKLLFGGFEWPSLNINLLLPEDWRFDHKIVKENPFNKNKEECEDEVDKLF